MSAQSIKDAVKAIDSLIAYYTTPLNIIPLAQTQKGDWAGALIGMAQVGMGVIQMIGRSIPNGFNISANAIAGMKSIYSMVDDYFVLSPGKVKSTDVLAALSSLASVAGIVAMGVLAPATAPLAITLTVTAAVVSSALTAWAVGSGVSNQVLELSPIVTGLKEALSKAGSLLGAAYDARLESLRSQTLPALGELVDIEWVDDRHVAFTGLSDKTRVVVDTSQLQDFGVDATGRAYVRGVLGEQASVSDPAVTFSKDGASAVVVNGINVATVPPGSAVRFDAEGVAIDSQVGTLKSRVIVTHDGMTVRWENADGSVLSEHRTTFSGSAPEVKWTQNGVVYQNGDLGAFISAAATDAAQVRSLARMQETQVSLAGSMRQPALGVEAALANAASNRYLADRLALNNVSDRWAPLVLSGSVSDYLSLSSTQSAAIRQALLNLGQTAWQTNRSHIDVAVTIFYKNGTVSTWATNPAMVFHHPLVLDLSGKGIELVAPWQSNATFDLDADGKAEASGWVGATNGILVLDRNGNGVIDNASEWFGEAFSRTGVAAPRGQNGFDALKTLAATGAEVFSRQTALTDDISGKSYFDLVQIWVDANQDGKTDKGELHTLAELGITSIDLHSVADGRQLGGGRIAATGGYTKADGTRGNVADVGLTENPAAMPVGTWIPGAAALAFADYVSKGYAALAAGHLSGVGSALDTQRIDFSAQAATLQAWMGTIRYQTSQGIPNRLFQVPDATLITTFRGEGYTAAGAYKSTAGKQALSLMQDSAIFDGRVRGTVLAATGAAQALVKAQTSAQIANATGSAASRVAASADAESSGNALGNAAARYLQDYAESARLAVRMEVLRIELNRLVPVNSSYEQHLPDGYSFFSPQDARFAADTFAAYASVLQALGNLRISLDGILAGFAQSAGYTRAYAGVQGAVLMLDDGFNLVLAGEGAQTIRLGGGVDHLMVNPYSGNVLLQGFRTGAEGDQVQFLGVGSSVTFSTISGGIRLSSADGTRTVDMAGVSADGFDLFANLAGVSAVSFAGMAQAGTRSLQGQRLYDGQVHVTAITASNHGDTLIGDSQASRLIGGSGNDTFVVLGTGYYIDGAGGTDRVSYAELGSGVTVDLRAGKDSLGSAIFRVENVTGTAWRDWLIGDGLNNRLEGGQGFDFLEGGGGNDIYVFGRGDGFDTVLNGLASYRTASSVLRLKAGVSGGQLWLERVGNDLSIQIAGSADRVQVRDWFSHEFRKLAAIELDNGMRLDTARIDAQVQAQAGWRAANPGFDPSVSATVPAEASLESHFVSGAGQGPSVPVGENPALEVKHLYESGTIESIAAAISAGAHGVSEKTSAAAGLTSAARSAKAQAAPLYVPAGQRAYRYRMEGSAETYITVTSADFSSSHPIFGKPSYVSWYEGISGLAADRIYLTRTASSGIPGANPTSTIVEVSASYLDAALNGLQRTQELLTGLPSRSLPFADLATTRHQALGAAANANSEGSAASRVAATTLAKQFATKFFNVMWNYAQLSETLAQAAASLNAALSLIPASVLPQATTAVSYSYYSSADAEKFNALLRARAATQLAYDEARARLEVLPGQIAALANHAEIRIAPIGGSVVAGPGGDLLVDLKNRFFSMTGGAGRDTFALGSSEGRGGIFDFQGGANGDRILLLRPTSDRLYVSEDRDDGSLKIEYLAGADDVRVTLVGKSLNDISFYENVVGVSLLHLADLDRSVEFSLDSPTIRAADGFVHIKDVIGTMLDDVIAGDSQDNVLGGLKGDDILMGLGGNNTLDGGEGIDTASYALAPAGIVVDMGAGVPVVNISEQTVLGGTARNGYGGIDKLLGIENIIGSDHDDVITGDAMANVLKGGRGNDVLDGRGGNDILEGGLGSDTYLFGRGYGVDRIVENDPSAGSKDIARFNAGISSDELWFRQVGQDLEVSIIGTNDKLFVTDWFKGSQYRVEEFQTAGGQKLLDTAVQNLVTAMAGFAPPASGQTTLPANYAGALAPVLAANWH